MLMHFIRTNLVLCLAAGLAAAAAPARKPNVVLILADDLGFGDLGCYGQTMFKTPNIDRLAGEGMRFTQFYAGSTVGAASRAALFTGRHSGHANIRGNREHGDQPLSAGDYTLSQMFRSAGYRVDGIGQWGLGGGGTSGEPKAKGFNQWIGFLEQVDAHDYYPELIWRYDSVSDWNGLRQNPGRQYIQDLFNSAMGRSVEINSDFQFFLYLPFTLLHANPQLKERGMQVPHDAPYTAEKWPQPEKNKAAMIARLDQSVGQLLARLEQHKLQRDTIVIFTSDNGPHNQGGVDPKFFKSSGPFRGLKGDLYEGGIRVPMIVWWPGRVDAGKVSEQPGAMWDVLPTLNEAIGQPALGGVDGLSMLPTWFGEKQTNQHDNLYWETHEPGFHQAIRLGDWKALRLKPAEGLELYDLKTDPGETKDVAAQHPEIVARIEEIMRASRTESNEWPSVQPLQPMTGVAVEKRREPVAVPPPKSPPRGN